MSFFRYQSFAQSRVAQTSHKGVTAVHSAKDRQALHMKPFGVRFAYRKPANPACVNLPRQISALCWSSLTPDCICSLVRFPQIFHSFTLIKLDPLSTVDLLTRLYRTSNKLSSGLQILTPIMRKGRCLVAGLEQAFEHALYQKLSKPTQLFRQFSSC